MTRQDIILNMRNKYDYAEFLRLSEVSELPPITWMMYVQVVETLDRAIALYPELAPYAAYMHYLADNDNTLYHKEQMENVDVRVPCTACGGGKVR